MTPHTRPEASAPKFHKVEINLPLDVADELAAKAGSVDAAVVHALHEYLRTDHARRDAMIRAIHSKGSAVANLAKVYAMSEETIQKIING